MMIYPVIFDYHTCHIILFKISSFKTNKTSRHVKIKEKMPHILEKKLSIDTLPEGAHVLDLLDKDLKEPNIILELKSTITEIKNKIK